MICQDCHKKCGCDNSSYCTKFCILCVSVYQCVISDLVLGLKIQDILNVFHIRFDKVCSLLIL